MQHEKPFRNIQRSYSICCIKILGMLSARMKYRAAPELSGTGATSACPQVTYIFLCFPLSSRRNLFEFVKTGDGLHCASCVRLGQTGAISVLRKSQGGQAWCLGLWLRKVCSAQEGAVPGPRSTITSWGAPWCSRDQHNHLYRIPAVLKQLGCRASQLPQQLRLRRGIVTDFAKKTKIKENHTRMRRVAKQLSF